MPGDPPRPKKKRPREGDIVEIETSAGLGYAQYVRRDAIHGPQIRVLDGVFAERPEFRELASRTARYYVYFLVGHAVSRGLVTLVGNEPVPAYAGNEGELVRLVEIWSLPLLADRIAENWRPV